MKILELKRTTAAIMIFVMGLVIGSVVTNVAHGQSNKKSLLWEISGNGLKKPSYLYGTIHLICPDDFVMNEATKKAVQDAEEIVLELDMDDPQFMTKAQQLAVNPGMANFSDKLNEKDKEVLNAFFTANYGVGLDKLGIMKPIGLLSMILMKSLSCPQPSSYESSFVSMAKEQEKEVTGLETMEFQMSLFDKIPFEEQISWLTEYAGDTEAMSESFDQMVESYVQQDLDGLLKLMTASPEMEGIEDELLYNRNANWISKIEEKAKEKSTFFAVGAGHLASEKGVIALLRKEGYTVNAMN